MVSTDYPTSELAAKRTKSLRVNPADTLRERQSSAEGNLLQRWTHRLRGLYVSTIKQQLTNSKTLAPPVNKLVRLPTSGNEQYA
jgi:hypothetical protein